MSDAGSNTAALEALLEAMDGRRALVVGDVVLDAYLHGAVERVSPEAPVPVVRVAREERVLGGAGNVVRNLLALGARCSLVSCVGEDDDAEQVGALLREAGVDPAGLVRIPGRPTTRKTRVVAGGQQIVRFDHEFDSPLPEAARRRIASGMTAALEDCALMVVADYGKGSCPTLELREAIAAARTRGVPVFVDPKYDLAPYRGASLVKPNRGEALALCGVREGSDAAADMETVAEQLQKELPGVDLVLTVGSDGMLWKGAAGDSGAIPALRREVFDLQGAGDTCIAMLSLARASGATLAEAALLATAAAAVVVGKAGTATAQRAEVRELLPAALDAAREPR